MNRVSNLSPSGDHEAPPLCRPAQPQELHSALRLILQEESRPATTEQVVDFLTFALNRGIDASNAWVAERGRQLLWAILPIVSPGRTMLLMAPHARPLPAQLPAARALTQHVVDHYRARGVHLVQVLLEPTDQPIMRLYSACGFTKMADLLYLQARIARAVQPPALSPGLELIHYSPARHDLFARTILASYESSMDCPALNGVRQIDDIIAGHKATGEHDPNLWYLLVDRQNPPRPLGTLLLSPAPQNETLELVYLGLLPAARGRGIGNLLMQLALACCWQRKCATLTLAVDAINLPALNLYHRHGMEHIAVKTVLMRDMRAPSATPATPASPVTY